MDLSGPGVVYAFMIVPSLFALAVVIGGIDKLVKHETGGVAGIIFGILFFILIIAAYVLFIR